MSLKDGVMKLKLFILLSIAFFMSGCSQKSTFFKEDAIEQSAVINTKKGQLYSSLEIKASITATYLNATLKKFKNSSNEMFLVSVFIENDSSFKDKRGLYNKDYELSLNGTKALKIEELSFKDDLIKVAPVRNHWSTYYLVEFNKQKSQKLKMVFKNDLYGAVVLEYLKEF